MSISIGSDILVNQLKTTQSSERANALERKLNTADTATDEELMEVCKDFEAYLVEKVFEQMRDAMTDEDENQGDYMKYFGDTLYEEYAKNIAENGEIGLAQQLYESMKRNQ